MRAPVLGCHDVLSMFLAVIKKRTAAIATIAVPKTISASPAKLPIPDPGGKLRDQPRREQPAGKTNQTSRRGSRRPSRLWPCGPKRERYARSPHGLKFLIIYPSYLRSAAGSMHLSRPHLECWFSNCWPPCRPSTLKSCATDEAGGDPLVL